MEKPDIIKKIYKAVNFQPQPSDYHYQEHHYGMASVSIVRVLIPNVNN